MFTSIISNLILLIHIQTKYFATDIYYILRGTRIILLSTNRGDFKEIEDY